MGKRYRSGTPQVESMSTGVRGIAFRCAPTERSSPAECRWSVGRRVCAIAADGSQEFRALYLVKLDGTLERRLTQDGFNDADEDSSHR